MKGSHVARICKAATARCEGVAHGHVCTGLIYGMLSLTYICLLPSACCGSTPQGWTWVTLHAGGLVQS